MIKKLLLAISSIGLPLFFHSCSCKKPVETETSHSDFAQPSGQIDPMSVNAACYVCHITFVGETISKTHFSQGVTCIKCHGISAGHANDRQTIASVFPILFAYSETRIDNMRQIYTG